MNNLYFNNKDLKKDFNCYMLAGYSYPIASEDVEDIIVEGNNFGSLTYRTGNYKDLQFSCNIRSVDMKDYTEKIAIIEEFINNIEDNRLYFKEMSYKCLRVKRVYSGNYIKNNNHSFDFSLNFICEPFWQPTDINKINLSGEDSFISNTHIPYEVFAECNSKGNTRIFINDELLQFNHNGKVFIDCERGYVYTEDKTLIETTGNTKLTIKKGINTYLSDTNTEILLSLKDRYRR